jgi:hypothetical protein
MKPVVPITVGLTKVGHNPVIIFQLLTAHNSNQFQITHRQEEYRANQGHKNSNNSSKAFLAPAY